MHRLARSGGGIGPARECRHQRGGTRVLEGKPSPWKQRARWFWQRSPRATDSLVEQGLWTAQRRDGSPFSRCRLVRTPRLGGGCSAGCWTGQRRGRGRPGNRTETAAERLHRTHGLLTEAALARQSRLVRPDGTPPGTTRRGNSLAACAGSRDAVEARAVAGQPAAARRRHPLRDDSPGACGAPTSPVGGWHETGGHAASAAVTQRSRSSAEETRREARVARVWMRASEVSPVTAVRRV